MAIYHCDDFVFESNGSLLFFQTSLLSKCQVSLDYIQNQSQSLSEIYEISKDPLRDGQIEYVETTLKKLSGFLNTKRGAGMIKK